MVLQALDVGQGWPSCHSRCRSQERSVKYIRDRGASQLGAGRIVAYLSPTLARDITGRAFFYVYREERAGDR